MFFKIERKFWKDEKLNRIFNFEILRERIIIFLNYFFNKCTNKWDILIYQSVILAVIFLLAFFNSLKVRIQRQIFENNARKFYFN